MVNHSRASHWSHKSKLLRYHKRDIHPAVIFHVRLNFIHLYQTGMQPKWRISFPQRSHTHFYVWDIRCDLQSASNTSSDKSRCPTLTPSHMETPFPWLMVSNIHITGFTPPVNSSRKISQSRIGGGLPLQLSLFNSIACLLWQIVSRFSLWRNITSCSQLYFQGQAPQ